MEKAKKQVLTEIIKYVDISAFLSMLEQGKEYVVEIPKKYQKDINDGKLVFMQGKKSGTTWPTLVKVLDNGKLEIVDNLPIKKKFTQKPEIYNSLSTFSMNTLMTETMNQQLNEIKNTQKIVEEIRENQKEEKISRLESGRKLIKQALNTKDEELKKNYIGNAMQDMTYSLTVIERTLKKKISCFEPLPNNRYKLILKEVKDDEYFINKDKEVLEIQEYYDLYLRALYLICSSNYIIGETSLIDSYYNEAIDTMKSLDFSNIKTIENIHSKCEDLFYNHPVEYIEIERDLLKKSFEGSTIVFTKSDIEEVNRNDKNQEIPETKTVSV